MFTSAIRAATRTTATRRLASLSTQIHIQRATMTTYQGTYLTLNTGAKVPALGFGTWQDKDAQESAVVEALKAGYRHIDTAAIYGTEPQVGRAIKQSGVPRSEIFITTKLWNNAHHPDDVARALDDSLKALDTDYVDLWLMHWPSAFARGETPFPKDNDGKAIPGDTDYVETYKAMEACLKSGKTRAIGVSNFSKEEMERLLKETDTVPAMHQLEMHPYLQQNTFTDWHAQKKIGITHYSPFGNQNTIYDAGQKMDALIEHPTLVEIGKKHGDKSGAQVALAWGISKGHSVIPKSKTPSRIRDNLQGDFKLDADDIKKIDGIDKKIRFNDPSGNFGYTFFKDLEGKK